MAHTTLIWVGEAGRQSPWLENGSRTGLALEGCAFQLTQPCGVGSNPNGSPRVPGGGNGEVHFPLFCGPLALGFSVSNLLQLCC